MQITNVTVKNAANADVTFVAKMGSSGDKIPARWSIDAASLIPRNRSTLNMASHSNGNGTTRIFQTELELKILGTIDGKESVIGLVPMRLYTALPTTLPENLVADAVTTGLNVLGAVKTREFILSGFAPRS